MEEILIAGFGGQGVMSMGQLIAYAGMKEGKYVSWLPSYGPEQRGGTANCAVVVSGEQVGSPLVSQPTTAIVLNNPSYYKFEPTVRPGGLLIVNASLISKTSERTDIKVMNLKATELANELGNPKIANMILLGAFLEITGILSDESILEALKKVLSPEKHSLLEINKRALELGRLSTKVGI
ncbi:2-oxoacid:acceptor oxidoreductase family protein [Mesobacillus subterraneus]|uniref:2-oxoacid:acceptor oxidoreductase family protein n=1 Tax=Mesobacillus subterraneus TaxID=285983 RepID=UPI00203DB1AF|nr:2-oxoacid:acceptor oxidoreductase family protein [Mesobacillus subterraneus]MCM3662807.1 2-oxoacid:acceptor oxidoreductase family protein [Mesobacillus subterraneus]MCM3683017.1 2-oxoacid:acceptor oxidoreductase family protein [Mesobacillus subterraneus]